MDRVPIRYHFRPYILLENADHIILAGYGNNLRENTGGEFPRRSYVVDLRVYPDCFLTRSTARFEQSINQLTPPVSADCRSISVGYNRLTRLDFDCTRFEIQILPLQPLGSYILTGNRQQWRKNPARRQGDPFYGISPASF